MNVRLRLIHSLAFKLFLLISLGTLAYLTIQVWQAPPPTDEPLPCPPGCLACQASSAEQRKQLDSFLLRTGSMEAPTTAASSSTPGAEAAPPSPTEPVPPALAEGPRPAAIPAHRKHSPMPAVDR